MASAEHLLARAKDDDDCSTLTQVESSATANTPGRIQDDIDGSTLAQVETTEPPSEGGSPDLESASKGDSKHADPVTSPRLAALKPTLARIDTILFRWGCLLQAILLYWAFLDLIQPPLNRHVISGGGGGVPLFFLSLPFIMISQALIVAVAAGVGFGILHLAASLAAFVDPHLPTSNQQRWSMVVLVVYGALGSLGGLAGFCFVF